MRAIARNVLTPQVSRYTGGENTKEKLRTNGEAYNRIQGDVGEYCDSVQEDGNAFERYRSGWM